jgi:hypothetical protein
MEGGRSVSTSLYDGLCLLYILFSTDTKVWDVIADLVSICTCPSPPNPFAVDLDFFEALPSPERVLATAAMISLLRSILASGTHRYDRRGNACPIEQCAVIVLS